MKRHFLTFLLLFLLGGAAYSQSSSDGKYKIYDAVIAEMFAGNKVAFDTQEKVKQFVVLDRTIDDPDYGKRDNWDRIKIILTDLSDEVVQDYRKNLAPSTVLIRSFAPPLPYSLLRQSELDVIRGDVQGGQMGDDAWATFYKQFPGSGGYISFSNIGFNRARDRALVYFVHWCRPLCGTGHYILLKKVEGKWSVERVARIWIS